MAKVGLQQLYVAFKVVWSISTTPQPVRDVVSKLEYLRPLLLEIHEKTLLLDRPIEKALVELKEQVERGMLLLERCRKVSLWQPKKYVYFNELVMLDKSLTPWLDRLPLQASALRSELLMRQQIDEQRRTNERYETLINSADATEAVVETQSDIQIQPLNPRRIQNWVFNRSYGLWAILFMIPFLLSIVMAATGSTGTKWILFNIGINNLGVNNY